MKELELSFACTPYDRVQPLITGEVKPQGLALRYTDLPSPDIFYRQLKFNQFDVSEMSFSSFLRARAQGWAYRMLPVFHNRTFSYTRILVRLAAGIRVGHPEDLRGKRVGVPDYQMSMALWTRGLLHHQFGLPPQEMEWVQERAERFSHGGATAFQPPPGLRFSYAATDFGTMFQRGELDATLIYVGRDNSALDRPKVALSRLRGVRPLFRDPRREALRSYRKLGFVPPHHITVVRESLLLEAPWAALSLMEAFERAKQLALRRLLRVPPSLLLFGAQELAQQRALFGDDPSPYGLQANAPAIQMAQTFSLEQGLTTAPQPWEELFPEELLIAEEGLPADALHPTLATPLASLGPGP
jgi:4,5-dihydroxyphthalate decarboxylase